MISHKTIKGPKLLSNANPLQAATPVSSTATRSCPFFCRSVGIDEAASCLKEHLLDVDVEMLVFVRLAAGLGGILKPGLCFV